MASAEKILEMLLSFIYLLQSHPCLFILPTFVGLLEWSLIWWGMTECTVIVWYAKALSNGKKFQVGMLRIKKLCIGPHGKFRYVYVHHSNLTWSIIFVSSNEGLFTSVYSSSVISTAECLNDWLHAWRRRNLILLSWSWSKTPWSSARARCTPFCMKFYETDMIDKHFKARITTCVRNEIHASGWVAGRWKGWYSVAVQDINVILPSGFRVFLPEPDFPWFCRIMIFENE